MEPKRNKYRENPNIIRMELRVSKALREEIKRLAKEDHRSVNGQAIFFLQEQIRLRKKQLEEDIEPPA